MLELIIVSKVLSNTAEIVVILRMAKRSVPAIPLSKRFKMLKSYRDLAVLVKNAFSIPQKNLLFSRNIVICQAPNKKCSNFRILRLD